MEIRQLRTLVHVADIGSLSRAADRLDVAQPALSRHIRMLEAELGAPLFRRHGRGMVPTDFGRRVLDEARGILAGLSAIRSLADGTRDVLSGRVRFGMTPTVAEILTVPLAKVIREAHPGLQLCFTVGFSGHLVDWLKRDEIDCCVSYDVQTSEAVRTETVLEEDLLLVGHAERGLSMQSPVPFATMADEALVLPSPLHGLRRIVDSHADSRGMALRPHIEADSFNAIVEFVREGLGATILPQAAIHKRLVSRELSAAPLIDPVPRRSVMLTYPVDRPVSAAARAAGDLFKQVATSLVRGGVWAGRLTGA